jgi:hypothetical protein
MNRTLRLGTLAAALALAALAPLRVSADPPSPRVEGEWEVVVGDEEFHYAARMNFAPGRVANEGSVVTTSEIDFTPPYPCVATQGAWTKTGNRTIKTTQRSFCFLDTPGQPAATLKLRDILTLTNDGNSFEGTEQIDFVTFDGSGEEVHVTVPIKGTRATVEPQS